MARRPTDEFIKIPRPRGESYRLTISGRETQTPSTRKVVSGVEAKGYAEPIRVYGNLKSGSANVSGSAITSEATNASKRRRPVIRNRKQLVLQVSALIATLEETADFNPKRQHNQTPPDLRTDLELDTHPEILIEVRTLITELKTLNGLLSSSQKIRDRKARPIVQVKKHLNSFLSNYSKTIGKGAGWLTIAIMANILCDLGVLNIPFDTLNKRITK